MAERTGKRISKKVGEDAVEFGLADEALLSSPTRRPEPPEMVDEAPAVTAVADSVERSPECLELSLPKLPSLNKGNLARLLMQSPNRLYFYWSIGKNPFHTLNRALGQAGNYTLV